MLSFKNLTIIFFIFISYHALSQQDFKTFGESAFTVQHKVSKKYSANFSMRSRYFLYRKAKFQYEQQQLDIFHFSTFKLNKNYKSSIGAYYRNRDFFDTGSNEFRLMEQFSYTKQPAIVRFRHRFRAEQRFLKDKTIFRQRYRFAVDFPINGKELDIGEPYFIGSLEGLLSLSDVESLEIDSRTVAQIGWQLSEIFKLQTGLEYRLEGFNLEAENSLYLLTAAVLKI